MDDYYTKYARPLGKINIFECKQNLASWRDSLREELESLIFLRNSLNNENMNKIETKIKNKLLSIINKMETISLKEIECITEFLFEIEKYAVHDVDDKIYTKLEYIRDNYNKILLNVQKMISSSPIMIEMREKYERNKSSLIQAFREKDMRETEVLNLKNNKNSGPNIYQDTSNNSTLQNREDKFEGKEWLDKLNNDVENLNKEQNYFSSKIDRKVLNVTSGYKNTVFKSDNNLAKEYTVDKDLDSILNNIRQSNLEKKYKSTEKKTNTKQKINTSVSVRNNAKRNFTPPEHSNAVNNISSYAIENTNSNPKNKANYDSIKTIKDEMEHIKLLCRELKKYQDENCVMENEKKIFDKIKNENIKLHADMNIIKEDLKEILTNYQHLVKRVNVLEEENRNLRTHNKNLVKFVNNTNPNNMRGFNNTTPNRVNNFNVDERENTNMNYNYQNNLSNVEYSSPLSEFSAFNTGQNQSTVEMNNNINNNIERSKKKRFLISKGEDNQFQY